MLQLNGQAIFSLIMPKIRAGSRTPFTLWLGPSSLFFFYILRNILIFVPAKMSSFITPLMLHSVYIHKSVLQGCRSDWVGR